MYIDVSLSINVPYSLFIMSWLAAAKRGIIKEEIKKAKREQIIQRRLFNERQKKIREIRRHEENDREVAEDMEKLYNVIRYKVIEDENDDDLPLHRPTIKIKTKEDAVRHVARMISMSSFLPYDVILYILSFIDHEGYHPSEVPSYREDMNRIRYVYTGRHFCGIPYGVWRAYSVFPGEFTFRTPSEDRCKKILRNKYDILVDSFNDEMSNLLLTKGRENRRGNLIYTTDLHCVHYSFTLGSFPGGHQYNRFITENHNLYYNAPLSPVRPGWQYMFVKVVMGQHNLGMLTHLNNINRGIREDESVEIYFCTTLYTPILNRGECASCDLLHGVKQKNRVGSPPRTEFMGW